MNYFCIEKIKGKKRKLEKMKKISKIKIKNEKEKILIFFTFQ